MQTTHGVVEAVEKGCIMRTLGPGCAKEHRFSDVLIAWDRLELLTRLPSVSKNDTYCPTPGISIGSPSTLPPASVTLLIDSLISSTAITMDECCAGQSGFFG